MKILHNMEKIFSKLYKLKIINKKLSIWEVLLMKKMFFEYITLFEYF